MKYIEIDQPSGKRIAKWMRTVCISEDGIIFVPSCIASSDSEIMLCASFDGTPIVNYLNHVFVPSTWMSVEFPKTKEVCVVIEAKVKEITAVKI